MPRGRSRWQLSTSSAGRICPSPASAELGTDRCEEAEIDQYCGYGASFTATMMSTCLHCFCQRLVLPFIYSIGLYLNYSSDISTEALPISLASDELSSKCQSGS